MWIQNVTLKNVRCFTDLNIELSKKITLLVGKNNTGKSTIMKSIAMLQYPNLLRSSDVRIDSSRAGEIKVYFKEGVSSSLTKRSDPVFTYFLGQNAGTFDDNTIIINSIEPNNIIYPFFSNRKAYNYSENVNESSAYSIEINNTNLAARLSIIANHIHPNHEAYRKACEAFFGRVISTIPSANGQLPGVYVNSNARIPISAMGDGVTSLVSLLVNLALAKNKIFLIEEPENDVHPEALKLLLELIIESSETNQFIVSTHSNIVLKILGEIESTKIKSIIQKDFNHYVSTVEDVGNNAEERWKLLSHLGYDFYDDDTYSAWIFFEESSAERLIRDFFIPWYAPKLKGRVRTYSANGVQQISSKFENFNSMFCYLNMQSRYKDRAWVIVDNGYEEKQILDKLKANYVDKNGWSEDRFIQFKCHDFESFYPSMFNDRCVEIFDQKDKRLKKEMKRKLLLDVLDWISSNEKEARKLFEKSAKEVVLVIRTIEDEIKRK